MNRRQLLAGTMLVFGETTFPAALTAFGQSNGSQSSHATLPVSPQHMLSAVCTEQILQKSLQSAAEWHPFPKAEERDVWQKVPQDIRDTLVHSAELVLGIDWPSPPVTSFLEYTRNGNRSHYEALYFARRQRLTNLVLGECMEGKGRFIDEIVNGIWHICEETSWTVPAHLSLQRQSHTGIADITEPVVDLFAAETAGILSWVYYLVGAQLKNISPLIPTRIELETKRRILDPALARTDFWWMGFDRSQQGTNNWNPWINSNWLMTNLLLEKDSRRRIDAILKLCRSLDVYISQYSPDGGCIEGPGYWQVSAASYFDCCTMLASATGGAVSVLNHPFLQKMAHYIADIHIDDHYYINYGDAHAKGGPSPELTYRFGDAVKDDVLKQFGAYYFVQKDTKADSARNLARSIPDILSATEIRNYKKADALELDAWYPALGLLSTREKQGSKEGFYLAIQATKNHRSHGHNDSGSFIVFHNGDPVFIDVGVEAYTAKTFSADRYSIWTMQSAYHNLPTVGGIMQSAGGDQYGASNISYIKDSSRTGLSMDLSTAYPTEAAISRWQREILLDRRAGKIQLTEDFQLQRAVPVVLSFMTPRIPKSSKGEVILTSTSQRAQDIHLKYDDHAIVSSFEKIELKDSGLRETWGDVIYRVLLTSASATDQAKWLMEIA